MITGRTYPVDPACPVKSESHLTGACPACPAEPRETDEVTVRAYFTGVASENGTRVGPVDGTGVNHVKY